MGYGAPVAEGVAILKVEEAEAVQCGSFPVALRGQEPDPCWRSRQGQVQGTRPRCKGRRSPGQVHRGSRFPRQGYARQHAGHSADGRCRQAGQPPLHRRWCGYRARTYCSLLVDRSVGQVAFVVYTEGGMDIEAVAHDTPEKIHTIAINPEAGVTVENVAAISKALELPAQQQKTPSALPCALQGLRRKGHWLSRSQPADRHEGRSPARSRRQDVLRRQRDLPP